MYFPDLRISRPSINYTEFRVSLPEQKLWSLKTGRCPTSLVTVDSDLESVKSYANALISKSRVQSCREHLLRNVSFATKDIDEWLKTFSVPEEGPTHHVMDLNAWVRKWDGKVERGKGVVVGRWGTSSIACTFILEAAAVRNGHGPGESAHKSSEIMDLTHTPD